MKKNSHSAGYFQPILLIFLTVAVIAGAFFGIQALADKALKTADGGWADEAAEKIVQASAKTATETEAATEAVEKAEGETEDAQAVSETEVQTEAQPQTETESEAESEAVYLVLKTGCNFRAGPSMDAEIYGTKEAGITVKFLEDLGGWYKVEIDGVTGYMGSQFF